MNSKFYKKELKDLNKNQNMMSISLKFINKQQKKDLEEGEESNKGIGEQSEKEVTLMAADLLGGG